MPVASRVNKAGWFRTINVWIGKVDELEGLIEEKIELGEMKRADVQSALKAIEALRCRLEDCNTHEVPVQ